MTKANEFQQLVQQRFEEVISSQPKRLQMELKLGNKLSVCEAEEDMSSAIPDEIKKDVYEVKTTSVVSYSDFEDTIPCGTTINLSMLISKKDFTVINIREVEGEKGVLASNLDNYIPQFFFTIASEKVENSHSVSFFVNVNLIHVVDDNVIKSNLGFQLLMDAEAITERQIEDFIKSTKGVGEEEIKDAEVVGEIKANDGQ